VERGGTRGVVEVGVERGVRSRWSLEITAKGSEGARVPVGLACQLHRHSVSVMSFRIP
jgi:hypothetical protein